MSLSLCNTHIYCMQSESVGYTSTGRSSKTCLLHKPTSPYHGYCITFFSLQNPKRNESQAMLSWCLEAASGFYLTLLQEICTAF